MLVFSHGLVFSRGCLSCSVYSACTRYWVQQQTSFPCKEGKDPAVLGTPAVRGFVVGMGDELSGEVLRKVTWAGGEGTSAHTAGRLMYSDRRKGRTCKGVCATLLCRLIGTVMCVKCSSANYCTCLSYVPLYGDMTASYLVYRNAIYLGNAWCMKQLRLSLTLYLEKWMIF